MPELAYPIVAVGDLHGQRPWLDALLARLERLPEWSAATLVFLGDLVDRGADVKGTVQRVMDLLAAKGGACVMGNHDLALVQAAGLGGDPDPFWVRKYATYDGSDDTVRSYLGEVPDYHMPDGWADWLRRLREAMPADHRAFLAGLPWVAEASGHVFLHNGLSPELDEPAVVQLELLRRRRWAGCVTPKLGTVTAAEYKPGYPVWLGADKRLSANPLPLPGRVQVTGHQRVEAPETNRVRIRLDTAGGVRPPLTACLLRGPAELPEFVASEGRGGGRGPRPAGVVKCERASAGRDRGQPVDVRYYSDPDTDQPHIFGHGVTEAEAEEVLRGGGEDIAGTRGARLKIGQTAAGRYLQVVYVPDTGTPAGCS